MEFSIQVSYPAASIQTKIDYSTDSFSSTNWEHTIVKPGKKWCVPLETVSQTQSNYIKITPIINNGEEKFEQQVINWNSSASHKLLSFNDRIFIQVLIEKTDINILYQNMNRVDFIYNLVLLPTVTFYNYLPYPISYRVSTETKNVKPSAVQEKAYLQPGESIKLKDAKIGSSYLLIEMENYAKSSWNASQLIECEKYDSAEEHKSSDKNKREELNMIEFRSKDAKIIVKYFLYVRKK